MNISIRRATGIMSTSSPGIIATPNLTDRSDSAINSAAERWESGDGYNVRNDGPIGLPTKIALTRFVHAQRLVDQL